MEPQNNANRAGADYDLNDKAMIQRVNKTASSPDRRSLLAVDVASALAASFVVAPIVAVIDVAVTKAAFGGHPIIHSVRATIPRLICGPHPLLLGGPFGAMYLLYAGTYITANTVDTLSCSAEVLVPGTPTSSLTKLSLVSTVNVGLALMKDNQFAKAFGAASARSFPMVTYVPLIVRDGITLYASFNLPPRISERLPEVCEEYMSRLSVAQLAAPAASQLFATPFHLCGLDMSHRRQRLGFLERWRYIRKAWPSTTAARAARVLPGLGLANVVNTSIRSQWISRLPS